MDIPDNIKAKTIPADKIVLLIAAIEKNGTFGANYKLMSAFSNGQYTASALEHQFRELRKAAQDLLEKNPDISPKDAVPTTPKKRKGETTTAANGDNNDEGSPRKPKSQRKLKTANAANVEHGDEGAGKPKSARKPKKTAAVKEEPTED